MSRATANGEAKKRKNTTIIIDQPMTTMTLNSPCPASSYEWLIRRAQGLEATSQQLPGTPRTKTWHQEPRA